MDISIIITNFNREKYLGRAVRSCINQILQGVLVETIVVDDCSTDNSLTCLDEFIDKVTVLQHSSNQGVAAASNTGIRASNGKYIMRVDSDDFLSSYACQIMYMILEMNPEFGYVYCDHVRVDEIGKKEEHIRLDSLDVLYKHGAGILFRKKDLYRVNLYNEGIKNGEDYDLLVRLSNQNIKGFYLPVPLYRYYIHGNNMTLNPDRDSYIMRIRSQHGLDKN